MTRQEKRDRRETLEAIRRQIQAVDKAKHDKKIAKELLDEYLDGLELKKQVDAAKEAVENARDRLFMFLGSDNGYISLKDGLDGAKHEVDFAQEILSTEVLAYRDEFETRSVEVDDETERPIILKATLGRKQEIQLELGIDGRQEQEQLV